MEFGELGKPLESDHCQNLQYLTVSEKSFTKTLHMVWVFT